MTKCEKCDNAKINLEVKPQTITCEVTNKTFMYGQRVNCPLNEEYNPTKGKKK